MAAVGAIWAIVVVTVVTSKPVSLNVGEDSSKSLESSESTSSEETFGPSQATFTESDVQMDPSLLPPADSGLFSVLPDLEDPQTSTDTGASPIEPKSPCQNAPGEDDSQLVCNSEAFVDAGEITGSTTPNILGPFQETPQDTAPPPLQLVTPAPPSLSTDSPLVTPSDPTPTGAPLCLTIQLTTPEPAPPRGDSM
nr:mucin-2 [Nothobranchius furzeri]